MSSPLFPVVIGLYAVLFVGQAWTLRTFWRWRRSGPRAPRDAYRVAAVEFGLCVLLLAIVLLSRRMQHERDAVVPPPPRVAAVPAAPRPALRASAVPIAPGGTETVSDEDIAVLLGEVAMPLDGVDPARLHSNFDERRSGGLRQHKALDLMAPRGTPIHSAAAGRVLKLFTSLLGGRMIYAADSSERFILMYAHLDGYAAGMRDGAPLSRGQLIGYVGSTGNAQANAPHLHFAIARSTDVRHWSRGRAIDPLPVLRAAAAERFFHHPTGAQP